VSAVLSSNAEERLLKRRINELEQEVKKLKRGMGRLKKRARKAEETEAELQDILDDETTVEFEQKKARKKEVMEKGPRCRNQDCKSDNTRKIQAGIRAVIVCSDCGARYTILSEVH
jgi:hypothetical protein